jgi:hypothetical protein
MTWLSYSDDEVARFHAVFEVEGNAALIESGREGEFRWDHHLRGLATRLVPDFVLVERATNRWRLAVEIKRRPESIFSDRNQAQAKSYAESPNATYRLGWPAYFALTNLEQTLLFALNGTSPPRDCRVEAADFTVGSLPVLQEDEFRRGLRRSLRALIETVMTVRTPVFDVAWPRIGRDFVEAAGSFVGLGQITSPTSTGWDTVNGVFGQSVGDDASQVLAFRCLLAEYLRGILQRHAHAGAATLTPVPTSRAGVPGQLPRVWDRLRSIDFSQLIDTSTMPPEDHLRAGATEIAAYLTRLSAPPTALFEMALGRGDEDELYPVLVGAANHDAPLDEKGKVPTDPELAALLAALVIDRPGSVIDPGCGDGVLLGAAYDRLRDVGASHAETLALLRGIEADELLTRLAILRLLTREPALIHAGTAVDVVRGDLFADPAAMAADFVLMNPPFRRYEDQGGVRFPPELRQHYASAIEHINAAPSIGTTGQQNLYTYYVEWAVMTASPGTRLGIILDNKWFHNRYATPLRDFLLRECQIEAVVEYPYSELFAGYIIATSILVVTRRLPGTTPGDVRFVRCSTDVTRADPTAVRRGLFEGATLPTGWSLRLKPQSDLRGDLGWKAHFVQTLENDFTSTLVPLPSLYEFGRRGSLAKEEGGMSALAFPFSRNSFGHRRTAVPQPARPYQNRRLRLLTRDENHRLVALAGLIPNRYRGFALENPDVVGSYELGEDDLLRQATLEPPRLRGLDVFDAKRRINWDAISAIALADLGDELTVAAFVEAFRDVTGLSDDLMPAGDLWIGLREPAAGGLIIPRKMRSGHKVFVNPFPRFPGDRQVKLSSNFLSYSHPSCVDGGAGINDHIANSVIAAFLLSSFGQLQLEMKGANREGLLAIEDHHMQEVVVLDPRQIGVMDRSRILAAFGDLPFPISNARLSAGQAQRNLLDHVFAEAIHHVDPSLDVEASLLEVHGLLDEYLLARQP